MPRKQTDKTKSRALWRSSFAVSILLVRDTYSKSACRYWTTAHGRTPIWLTFESTDIACKRATVWLRWSIATKPITTGTVYLCATKTDQSKGFTLGMLFSAALHHSDDVEDELYYHNWQLEDGFDNWKETTDPLVQLIEQLQTETGERAYMVSLQIDTMDVIQPSDAERDMVGDA
ncbi:hypothetical protein LTR22_002416 [Elasticomyces elasticus]|nr:hypothetical protein LTR22_002416 [Elasticomyces elasticus]KAK4918853.1 hypothetical protein LTR49_013484 [Elasticomyces elasticus]KAK5758770.1 hypothetical protein LTS12_011164 [Elasticomyces elasticus]